MGKLYKNQALKLTLIAGVEITGATVVQIKYANPDDTEVAVTATPENETTGEVYYDFPNDVINMAGVWRFWVFITMGGKSYPGEPIRLKFFNEGFFK